MSSLNNKFEQRYIRPDEQPLPKIVKESNPSFLSAKASFLATQSLQQPVYQSAMRVTKGS